MRQIKIIGLIFLLLGGLTSYVMGRTDSGKAFLLSKNQQYTLEDSPSNPYFSFIFDGKKNNLSEASETGLPWMASLPVINQQSFKNISCFGLIDSANGILHVKLQSSSIKLEKSSNKAFKCIIFISICRTEADMPLLNQAVKLGTASLKSITPHGRPIAQSNSIKHIVNQTKAGIGMLLDCYKQTRSLQSFKIQILCNAISESIIHINYFGR